MRLIFQFTYVQYCRCLTWNLYRDLVLNTIDKLVRKGCFYIPGKYWNNTITWQCANIFTTTCHRVLEDHGCFSATTSSIFPWTWHCATFWLFLSLKNYLEGHFFRSRCAIVSAICFHISDYVNAFRKLVKQLKLCITMNKKYFDGMKETFW